MATNPQHLDSDGVTAVTGINWGTLVAGVGVPPRKFGVKNITDGILTNLNAEIQAIQGNDGSTQFRIAADSSGTISSPWGFGAAVGGSGGVWGSTGIRGYKITSLNANGESGPSDEITADVDTVTKKVTLTWTQTPTATGYKIYRTDTPGTYGASSLRTTIGSGATVTFVDDGTATTTGTLPTKNTTGGWGLGAVLSGTGQGGTWGVLGVYYWKVVAYDAAGAEITNTFEASVNVDEATKKVTLSWADISGQATSIKVFRSQTTGVYTTPALVATLAGSATSYADTGTAVTTGGWSGVQGYGIPPTPGSFGTSAFLLDASVAIGEEVFYWGKLVIPAGTPSQGNPRQAITAAVEEP